MIHPAESRNPETVLKVDYAHAREHADNYWNYRTDKATNPQAIGKCTNYIRNQEEQ